MCRNLKPTILFLCLLFSLSILFAQQKKERIPDMAKIDSLTALLDKKIPDTARVHILYSLGYEYLDHATAETEIQKKNLSRIQFRLADKMRENYRYAMALEGKKPWK